MSSTAQPSRQRAVYSPTELLALKANALEPAPTKLPDLPCVSTSPTFRSMSLPTRASPVTSNGPTSDSTPLFRMARSTKVTMRSPDSTAPSTPISPTSPPPPAMASPTSPRPTDGSDTPLFQAARPSRVSIRPPPANEIEIGLGITAGMGQAVKIPGRGASRAVVAPTLPSSPVQEKRELEAPPVSAAKSGADVPAESLAKIDAMQPLADQLASLNIVELSGGAAPVIGRKPVGLPTKPMEYPSPDPEVPSPNASRRSIRQSSPQASPNVNNPMARDGPSASASASPSEVRAKPQRRSSGRAASSAGQSDGQTMPTPPTSPSTAVDSKAPAGERRPGSTPSGRMVAGALGLKKEKKDAAGGGGGYVRAEVVVERKLTGRELDEKIKRIREENRRIEADYAKEDLDRQSHSPTRSPTVAQQETLRETRANAQRKLTDAETEIERLKRELDKAVQAKIDAEREGARDVKLKALQSGSLDWDASKKDVKVTQASPSEVQPLHKGRDPSSGLDNPSTAAHSPYDRPSRPVFPPDVNDEVSPATRTGVTHQEGEDGRAKRVATPKRSVSSGESGTQS